MVDRLGEDLATHVSEHFAMVYAPSQTSSAAVQRAFGLLERTHEEFYLSMRSAGFAPQPLSERLVWVSFGNAEQFSRYARETERMNLSWLDSYYSSRTNRVVTTRCSSERMTHEAAHQLAFNSGLQTRGVMYPLWVSEGLATNFEADSSGAMGFGRDNPVRRERLLAARAADRLVWLPDFLTLTRPATGELDAANDLYAQSWGVFRFLFAHRRADLRRYLAALSAADPGWRDPSTLEHEIEAAFGSREPLTAAWERFLEQLVVPSAPAESPQLAAGSVESPGGAP